MRVVIVAMIVMTSAAAADDKQKLGVVFFALLFGIGLVMTPTPATNAFKDALQGLFEISMTLIGLVIRTAPYAVAFMMFGLTAEFGWELLLTLGMFALTVVAALAVHMFVVLPLWVTYVGRMSPARFFRDSEENTLALMCEMPKQ